MTRVLTWRPAAVSMAVLAALTLGISACSSSSSGGARTGGHSASVDQSARAMLPKSIRDSGVLRVGTPLTNPPAIFKEGSTVEGVGADLITEVANELGLRVQYVETPFPGVLAGLSADKFDVVAGVSFNDTVEREKSIDIVSLVANQGGFLVRKGNPEHINTLDDMCGRRAGTLNGSDQAVMLAAKNKQCAAGGKSAIDIKLYPDAPTTLAQLRAGKIDVFVGNLIYVAYIAKTVDNGNALEVPKGAIYPNGVLGIGLSKGHDELAKAVQAAIKTSIVSGQYRSILAKWDIASQALPVSKIVINGATNHEFTEYGI